MEPLRWMFARCWPIGEQCQVDWDAWAVAIGAFALWIGAVTVVVACVSAWAVWRLGQQANAIASATHQIAGLERRREARFLLAYIFADVARAHAYVAAWIEVKGPLVRRFPSMGPANQTSFLKHIADLQMPLVDAHFSRLHVVDGAAGVSIARALSTIHVLQLACKSAMGSNPSSKADAANNVLEHAIALEADLLIVRNAADMARKMF